MGLRFVTPLTSLVATVVLFTDVPFVSGAVHTVEVATEDDYGYRQVIPPEGIEISTLSRLDFSVQSCSDAFLLLSQHPTTEQPMYEFVLGVWHNAGSVIREQKNGPNVAMAFGAVLSCTEFRDFFVNWTMEGVVMVGTVQSHGVDIDKAVETVFLTYEDTTPFPVRYVFVSGDDEIPGLWRFKFDDVVSTTVSSVEATTSEDAVTTSSLGTTGSDSTSLPSPGRSTTDDDVTTALSTLTSDVTITEMTSTKHVVTSENGDLSSQMTSTDHVITSDTDDVSFEMTSTDRMITSDTGDVSSETTSTNYVTTSVISTRMTTIDHVTASDVSFVILTTGNLNTTLQPALEQTTHCPCTCALPFNTSEIEPQDPEEISAELLIPANTTSAARRRRTCATDDRPSSTAIGAVGIVCLSVPVLLMVCSDLMSLHRHFGK